MKKELFIFEVDENDRVLPVFDPKKRLKDIQSTKHVSMKIYGESDSSLIAISAVADYFEYEFAKDIEWSFISHDQIRKNTLIATINYL